MISLKFFLILQSVLVISKIGLPRRDSCREKLSVWKKQKPWNTGGRLVAFVLLGRFIQSWTIYAEWITSLVQIFSFSYIDLRFQTASQYLNLAHKRVKNEYSLPSNWQHLQEIVWHFCLPLSFCTRVPTKSIFPCIFVRVAKSFFLSRVGTQSTIIKTGIIISMKNSLNSTL